MPSLKSFENDLKIWVPRTIAAVVVLYFSIGVIGNAVEICHDIYLKLDDKGILLYVIIIFAGMLLVFLYVFYKIVLELFNGIKNWYKFLKNKILATINKYYQRIPKKWHRLMVIVWITYNLITFPLLGSRFWVLYDPLFNWIVFQLLFIFIIWGILWAKEGYENNKQ